MRGSLWTIATSGGSLIMLKTAVPGLFSDRFIEGCTSDGLITVSEDRLDPRKTVLSLTLKGQAIMGLT